MAAEAVYSFPAFLSMRARVLCVEDDGGELFVIGSLIMTCLRTEGEMRRRPR